MRAALVVLAAGGVVAGCTDTVLHEAHIGSTRALVTSADLRIVTERPGRSGGPSIVCAEPPPDVAKALATAAKVAAGVTTPSSVGGNASVSNATAEQLAELSGRVPGLLALRDGLYRTCEAYANGPLGADAYALVLSRYGDLLTTLLLADAASGAGAQDLTRLQDQPLASPPPEAPPGAAPLTPTPGGTGKKVVVDSAIRAVPAMSWGGAAVRPVATAAPAPVARPAPGAQPASQPAPPSTSTAVTIAGMQALYLQHSPAGPILVACINAFDPTRIHVEDGPPNTLLRKVCPDFMKGLAAATVDLVRAQGELVRAQAAAYTYKASAPGTAPPRPPHAP